MPNFIHLTTDSAIIINRLAALLEEKNIPFLVKDNTESGRLAGFGTAQNDVELYVNSGDLENVQQLMKTELNE